MDEYKVVAIRYSCGHEGEVRVDPALDVSAVGLCWKCAIAERVIKVPSVSEPHRPKNKKRPKNGKKRFERQEERTLLWLRAQNKMKDELISAYPEQTKRNLQIIKNLMYSKRRLNILRRRFALYRLAKLGYSFSNIQDMVDALNMRFLAVKVEIGFAIAHDCMSKQDCPLRPLAELINVHAEKDLE